MTSIEEALRSGAVLAKVKPLEWQDDHYGEEAQADTPWGMWCVTKSYNDSENKRSAHFTPSFRVKRSIHPDVKAAKAAAQADYEARILSALSPDPALLALIEERDRLKGILERCRTVLGNMARENEGAIFNRWPISHEPLRADARNLLPLIEKEFGCES